MLHQEHVILQIDQLTKKFGDLTAVDKLSLSVFKNEIFGFLGPNVWDENQRSQKEKH